MDAALKSSSTPANSYQTFDYLVVGDIVPVLNDSGQNGSIEDAQHAQLAAYIQRGAIPQLPGFGVEWVEYFTGGVNIGTVDGEIKQNLISIGLSNYRPNYDLVNEKLTVAVVNR